MPGRAKTTYRRILVPVDGSPASNLGLREAIRLAKGQGASLQLVHMVDQQAAFSGDEVRAVLTELLPVLREAGRRILRNAQALVRKQGLACTAALIESPMGPAAPAVVRQAKKWCADLVIIGTHGRRGVRRLVLGSDAEEIVRTCPVPVLLVRAPRSR